jgi:hypothetical protein
METGRRASCDAHLRPVFRRRQQTILFDDGLPAYRDNAKGLFAGISETGATGLEPATSGVTGRFERHDG